MEQKQETADLYREIGRMMKSRGAQRVYLYSARMVSEETMELKVITEETIEIAEAERAVKQQYPKVNLEIIDGSQPERMELLSEAMVDSIQI